MPYHQKEGLLIATLAIPIGYAAFWWRRLCAWTNLCKVRPTRRKKPQRDSVGKSELTKGHALPLADYPQNKVTSDPSGNPTR